MSVARKIKMFMEFTQLHKHFQTYFQVVPAVTDALVMEAQKIRHDVYCRELGWETVRDDGLEKDAFDDHSLHCLLRSRTREKYIGCIRLVLPTDSGNGLSLPFQETCRGLLDVGHPDPRVMGDLQVAEVSRLAISADYRRRRNEKGRPVSFGDRQSVKEERRKFPYIPVALYLGMLEMASRKDIKTLYILTEPLLAKHFSRLGGKLQPVGQGVEHRGLRVPYIMDVEEVLREARLMMRPLIRTIRKEVRTQMDAAGQ